MAMHRAFPPKLGEIDPRYLTPAFSSWLFGGVSSHGYVGLVCSAGSTAATCCRWSVISVGLMISYYYGQTGIACVLYFRRYLFTSVRNFFLVGLLPLIGGLSLAVLFLWSLKDMTRPRLRESDPSAGWA